MRRSSLRLERQFGEYTSQVAAREGPLEWSGQRLIVTLKRQEAVLNVGQRIEVVRRQDLALHDREVNLDLIEPTGMDGSVNEHQIRILLLQSCHGARTAVRRAVVDDPKHAARVSIERPRHDLFDQSVERGDTGGGLAAPKEPSLMHIQGGQVGPGAGALVLMLDLHYRPGPGRRRRVAAAASLNVRLLIGGDHEVISGQGVLLPDALVEIQDPPGLGRKLRIARKDPAAVAAGWPGEVTLPGLPQIRTCPIRASGSSAYGLAARR